MLISCTPKSLFLRFGEKAADSDIAPKVTTTCPLLLDDPNLVLTGSELCHVTEAIQMQRTKRPGATECKEVQTLAATGSSRLHTGGATLPNRSIVAGCDAFSRVGNPDCGFCGKGRPSPSCSTRNRSQTHVQTFERADITLFALLGKGTPAKLPRLRKAGLL